LWDEQDNGGPLWGKTRVSADTGAEGRISKRGRTGILGQSGGGSRNILQQRRRKNPGEKEERKKITAEKTKKPGSRNDKVGGEGGLLGNPLEKKKLKGTVLEKPCKKGSEELRARGRKGKGGRKLAENTESLGGMRYGNRARNARCRIKK